MAKLTKKDLTPEALATLKESRADEKARAARVKAYAEWKKGNDVVNLRAANAEWFEREKRYYQKQGTSFPGGTLVERDRRARVTAHMALEAGIPLTAHEVELTTPLDEEFATPSAPSSLPPTAASLPASASTSPPPSPIESSPAPPPSSVSPPTIDLSVLPPAPTPTPSSSSPSPKTKVVKDAAYWRDKKRAQRQAARSNVANPRKAPRNKAP